MGNYMVGDTDMDSAVKIFKDSIINLISVLMLISFVYATVELITSWVKWGDDARCFSNNCVVY